MRYNTVGYLGGGYGWGRRGGGGQGDDAAGEIRKRGMVI